MHHGDVDVPFRRVGLLLRRELFIDLLRSRITGTRADRAHLHPGVHRFELGREEIVHVVDHILVARAYDIQRRLGANAGGESQRDQ